MPDAPRPFPEAMRAQAQRIASRAGALRARVRGGSSPDLAPPDERADESWTELIRDLERTKTSFAAFDTWRSRAKMDTPPRLAVETMGERFAELIESVARQGYYRERTVPQSGELSVIGEGWPALYATEFLISFRPSRPTRARLDEAIALLQQVLDSGVCYYQFDRPGYDDVTAHYDDLVTCLYDFRSSFAWALRDGALLLHGGTPALRLLVAQEIHFHRLSGHSRRRGGRLVVIVEGELKGVNATEHDTVYIPDPIALSENEQAWLFERVNPAGPPQPTILGAGVRESFATLGRARFSERLQERLFRNEYDLGLETDGI